MQFEDSFGNTSIDIIKNISDKNSFIEFQFKNIDLSKKLNYEEKFEIAKKKSGKEEAIVIGRCKIGGFNVVLGVMESKFMSGTLSVDVGEKITRAFEFAIKKNLPVVLFLSSAGARVQEGIFSLVQMAKISAVMKCHNNKRLLYISCLTNPTMGGVTASFGLYGDINISEKNIQIGFAGKKIIENLYKEKSENIFQTEINYQKNGMIDIILDKNDIKNILIDLLYLTKKNKTNKININKNVEYKKSNFTNYNYLNIFKEVRSLTRYKGIDYLNKIFDRYVELKGDRINSDDSSIISGIGSINNMNFVFNIQNKGKNINENIKRNFGLTKPEGYRKILRVSKIAEKFKLPIINIIDSAGADCSVYSEENGQARAIADCIYNFVDLKTIIISIIIGEASSGGGLALAISDSIAMLEKSIYTVISPEFYLQITNKNEVINDELLKKMRINSNFLLEDKIIDDVLSETNDLNFNADNIKNYILNKYLLLNKKSIKYIIKRRYSRIRNWDKVARGFI